MKTIVQNKITTLFLNIFTISYISFSLTSCKDQVVTEQPRASVSLVARDTISSDNPADTILTLDSAKFLIETLRLHRGGDSSTIKVGPFRVFVSILGEVTVWGVNEVSPGTYTKVGFKIHKYNPNEPLPENDSDFVDPVNQVGYSGVIAGRWNGTQFVYKSDITVWQQYNLDNALEIPAASVLYNVYHSLRIPQMVLGQEQQCLSRPNESG